MLFNIWYVIRFDFFSWMTDYDFIFTFPVSIGLVWDSDRPETSTITDVCRCIGTTILLQDVSSISLLHV